MSLPTINNIEFFTEIPSSKKEIKYRPFTVREQKSLLVAKLSDNQKDIINAVLNTIKDCVLDDINVEELANFDAEFLFLKIRGKSMGEDIPFQLRHGDCKPTELSLNVDDVKVFFPEKIKTKFMINDKYGVVVKYPSFKDLELLNSTNNVEDNLRFLAANLVMVYDSEKVYDNFNREDAYNFILSLTTEQLDKVNEFFVDLPVLKHIVKFKCADCGEETETELRGLSDFFSLG